MKPRITSLIIAAMLLMAACSTGNNPSDRDSGSQQDDPRDSSSEVETGGSNWDFSAVYEYKASDTSSDILIEFTGSIRLNPDGSIAASLGRGGTAGGSFGVKDDVENCVATSPVNFIFDHTPDARLVQVASSSAPHVLLSFTGFVYETQDVPQLPSCVQLSDEFRVNSITHLIENVLPNFDPAFRTIPLEDEATKCNEIPFGDGVTFEFCYYIKLAAE